MVNKFLQSYCVRGTRFWIFDRRISILLGVPNLIQLLHLGDRIFTEEHCLLMRATIFIINLRGSFLYIYSTDVDFSAVSNKSSYI